MVVTPHVAQKSRHSAIDGRTTRHPGYAKSQRRRKKIDEPFGWAKIVGGLAQTMYRAIKRVSAEALRSRFHGWGPHGQVSDEMSGFGMLAKLPSKGLVDAPSKED